MLLILSSMLSGSTDGMVQILNERNIPVFRFNLDMFEHYQFVWSDNSFTIIDPTGRRCKSSDITAIACYKGIIAPWYSFNEDKPYNSEREWLISWLNNVYDCIISYGIENKLIRLWRPYGWGYAKTRQMNIAKRFFDVPNFKICWGQHLKDKNVIVKPLTQRPLSCREMAYAKIVNQAELDQEWPWFIQEIAKGNRDATVLYILGKVHCFQFASERGDIVDWRITQGTEQNRWISWNPGEEFENKIRSYMDLLGLKYGRLDFIIGAEAPEFLEVNSEGQFGWLDDDNLTLHKEIVDAILDSRSTIIL